MNDFWLFMLYFISAIILLCVVIFVGLYIMGYFKFDIVGAIDSETVSLVRKQQLTPLKSCIIEVVAHNDDLFCRALVKLFVQKIHQIPQIPTTSELCALIELGALQLTLFNVVAPITDELFWDLQKTSLKNLFALCTLSR